MRSYVSQPLLGFSERVSFVLRRLLKRIPTSEQADLWFLCQKGLGKPRPLLGEKAPSGACQSQELTFEVLPFAHFEPADFGAPKACSEFVEDGYSSSM